MDDNEKSLWPSGEGASKPEKNVSLIPLASAGLKSGADHLAASMGLNSCQENCGQELGGEENWQ